MARTLTLQLNSAELALLVDALDSHEYWQLGYDLPRTNGLVFVPGDREPDTMWEGRAVTDEDRQSIRSIAECRALAARLEALLGRS